MAHYDGPAGGCGLLKGIASIFGKELDKPSVINTLMRQNKPDGVGANTLCTRILFAC
jgi:hypothetical protein